MADGRVPSEADIGAFVHREMSAEASRLLKSAPSPGISAGGAAMDDYSDQPAMSTETSAVRSTKGSRLRKKFRESRNRSLTREQKRELLFMVSDKARNSEYDAERSSRAAEDDGPRDERQSGRLNAERGSGSLTSLFARKSDDKSLISSPHTSNRLHVLTEPMYGSSKLNGASSPPSSPHTSNRFKSAALQASRSPHRPSDPGYFWPEDKSPRKNASSPRTSQTGAAPPSPTNERSSRPSANRSILQLLTGKGRTSNNKDPNDAPLSMLLQSLTQDSAVLVRSKDPSELPLADDSMDFMPPSPSLTVSLPPESPSRNLKKVLSAIPEMEHRTGSLIAMEGGQDSLLAPVAEEQQQLPSSPVRGKNSPSDLISPRASALDSPSARGSGRPLKAKLPPMSPKVFVSPPKK